MFTSSPVYPYVSIKELVLISPFLFLISERRNDLVPVDQMYAEKKAG